MKQPRPNLGSAFFRSLSPESSLRLMAAVFFTFSGMGFLVDISDLGAHPTAFLVVEVIGWGLVGVGYAYSATLARRRMLILPFVIAAHVLLSMFTDDVTERMARSAAPAPRNLETRFKIDALGAAMALGVGYAFFMMFIRKEGSRYLVHHTEIALARTIHRGLVPPIDRRIGGFEFYGASHPSGDVGGDLVDVVGDDPRWIACVADVSGHGVPAGVVMGMFKSAARMRLTSSVGVDALFADVNRVMFDLKTPNMFITCACVRHEGSGRIEFGLAGHLPVLHFRNDTRLIAELSVGHVPLGLFEDGTFPSGHADVRPGDLLVLLTDGLTEVIDAAGEEFGLERVKEVVLEHSRSPLPQLFDAIINRVRAHGPQFDDQTLLLARYVSVPVN